MNTQNSTLHCRVSQPNRMLALVLCLLIALTQFPVTAHADVTAAFNEELLDEGWLFAGGGSFSGTGGDLLVTLNAASVSEPSEGTCSIDLTDLADAVDAEELHVSINSSVSPASATSLGAEVSFMAGSTSLSDGDTIPKDCRTITVTAVNPTVSEVSFTLSLAFNDTQAPALSLSVTPETWTNGSVTITPTATDEGESGIFEVYECDNTGTAITENPLDKIGESYTVTQNGTYYFAAVDFAGKQTIESCTISNIDQNEPVAPIISLSTESGWATSPVTATITTDDTAAGESPQTVEYSLDGGNWQTYGGEFTISDQGSTTIDARVADEAGNVSDNAVNKTANVDTEAPQITAEFGPTGTNNMATLTFGADDGVNGSGILEKRYREGTFDDTGYADATVLAGTTVSLTAGKSYTVFAKDNAGHVSVHVLYASSVPTLSLPGSFEIDESQTKALEILVSDSETAYGSLTVEATSADPSALSVGSIQNDTGTVSVSLTAADIVLTDRTVNLNISVTDGDGQESTGIVPVTLKPVNDAPVASDDTATVSEDGDITINVLLNDQDEENGTLTITAVDNPPHGSAQISANQILYTPDPDYNGTDSFAYTVSDGSKSSTAQVDVTVNSVPDAPVAKDSSRSTAEDTFIELDLLDPAFVTDKDLGSTQGDTLFISAIDTATLSTRGTITLLNADGDPVEGGEPCVKIRYTPESEFSGMDKFRYTVEDSHGLTSTAAITMLVSAVNDAPAYHSLSSLYTIDEDSDPYTISFTVSDKETPADSLMLQAICLDDDIIPNDTLQLNKQESGAVTLELQPDTNQNGDARIKFTLGDGFDPVIEIITVHVTPINDRPVANNDTITYTEDTACTINPNTLLANDSDVEDTKPTFIGFEGWPDSAGTLTPSGDNYIYQPVLNYTGTVFFTYKVEDTEGEEALATIRLQANAVNDTPTISASQSSVTIPEDSSTSPIAFTIHDEESAPNSLTVTAGSNNNRLISPSGIVLTTSGADRTITLTPNPNEFGTATITLTVSDGLSSSTDTIVLTVTGVQDEPAAADDTITAQKSGKTNFAAVSLLANDSDPDGDTLELTLYTQPALGTLTLVGGQFTYQVNTDIPDATATDSFTYTVADGNGNTATANVTISLSGESAAPVISSMADQYLLEDFTETSLVLQISDPDGTTPDVYVSADTASIVNTQLVSVGSDHSLKLTSIANMYGEVNFTITAVDGAGKQAEVQFKLTVYPVNDKPVAGDVTLDVQEDIATNFSLLNLAGSAISDVENDTLKIVSITPDGTTYGRLTMQGGLYRYDPNTNVNGVTDTYTYVVSDGKDETAGKLNVSISPVNDAPWFSRDGVIYQHVDDIIDTEVTIDIVSSTYAHDVDDTEFYIHSNTEAGKGIVSVVNNQIVYKRTNTGSDSFTVTIRDRETIDTPFNISSAPDGYRTATVTVVIGSGTGNSIWAYGAYAERDEDAAPFTISLDCWVSEGLGYDITLGSNNTAIGTAFIDSASKTITYTPQPDANGTDTFEYTITATGDGSESLTPKTANVSVYLRPVNDAPEFDDAPEKDSTVVIDEDSMASGFSILVSDVDGDDLTLNAYAINADPDKPVLLPAGVELTGEGINAYTLDLTPVKDSNGDVTITLSVSDGVISTLQSFTLHVNPINDKPVARDYTFHILEDTPATFTLVDANSDIDNLPTSLTLSCGDAASGSLVINGDSVTYTPDANFYGNDQFTYTITDPGGGVSDTATVSIVIDNVNDPPRISGLAPTVVMLEDSTASTLFTVLDEDAEDTHTYAASIQSQTDGLFLPGGLTAEEGKITFTPEDNQYGTATVTLTVTDAEGAQATENIIVTVLPENDLPIAEDDSTTLLEDGNVTLNITDNDTDVEDAVGSLRILAVNSAGAHGTVTVSEDKHSVTYRPTHNYAGSASLLYCVIDSNGGSSEWATVTFNITPVNDAPSAGNDAITIQEDPAAPALINVLGNDSDAEGSSLTITSPDEGGIATAHGTAALLEGKIAYQPAANFYGTDTFQYTINDGELSATATVTITVTPFNDMPTIANITPFVDDSGDLCWLMDEDELKAFLFSASDAPNETPPQSLLVDITSDNQTLLPDSSIIYAGSTTQKSVTIKPAENRYGDVHLTITADDGVNIATEVFLLRVRLVNDAPVLTTDESIQTNEDTAYSGSSSGYDAEHSDLNFSITQNALHGNVTINAAAGAYTYTPDENYYGSDSFTICVNDEELESKDEVVVSVDVLPVNDLPVAADDTVATDEDTPILFTYFDLVVNDSDIETTDNMKFTITGVSSAQHGTASLNTTDKTVTFTPSLNYFGTGSFIYTLRDEHGGTATATVTITINAVNDVPTAKVSSVTIKENDAPKEVAIGTLASDVESDTLTITAAAWQEVGTTFASFTNDGDKLTITPNRDWHETANQTLHLAYTVEETGTPANSVNGTLTVILEPENDNPIITVDTVGTVTFKEDIESGSVTFTVWDEEDDVSLLTVTSQEPDHIIDTDLLDGSLLESTGALRSATLTSLPDANGNSTVTLTVRDSGGKTGADIFDVSVTPVNDEPRQLSHTVNIQENDGATRIDTLQLANEVDDDTMIVIYASIQETEDFGATAYLQDDALYIAPDPDWKHTTTQTIHVDYTVQETGTLDNFTEDGVLTVNLIPENDPPTITITSPSSLSFDEDTVSPLISFTVIDEEDDEALLDLDVTASGGGGIINITALNTALAGGTGASRDVAATTLLDQNGDTSLTFTVEDSNGDTGTDTLSVHVEPVNDAPRLKANPEFSLNENAGKTAVPMTALIMDVDTINAELEVVDSSVGLAGGETEAYGAAFTVEDGVLYITPDADWTYTQTQTFHLNYIVAETSTAQNYESDVGTLAVHLLPVNDAPVISAISDQTMDEKTSRLITFTVTDEDDAASAVSVTVTPTVHTLFKTITIASDNTDPSEKSCEFTLETTRYYGETDITINAKDDENKSATPEVFHLSVGWKNDNPLAVDDDYSLNEDGSLLMDVLANDEDDDVGIGGAHTQTLSILADSVSVPTHGTAVIQGSEVLYTPDAHYNGPDSFTYSVTDADISSIPSQATVTVTVNPVNDAPVAVNDTAFTQEDTALTLTASSLLANDTDIDNDTLALTGVLSTAGTHGTVSFNSLTGIVTYTPTLNYNGPADFTYSIADGNGGTDTGTVDITLNPVNDPPIAVDDSVTVAEDAIEATLTVLANDSDVENDTLTITGVTQPAHGVVSINSGSTTLSYSPAADNTADVTFTYTISDGNSGFDTATVTVNIDEENDAPVAEDDTATIAEDAPETSIDVLANDTDVDGDTLSVTAVSDVLNGTAQIETGGGSVLFTPDTDFHGTASFSYTVSDGGGGTDTAEVTITVTPVNDAPVADNDAYTVIEDASATAFDLLLNDSDVDGDDLTITAVSEEANGTAQVQPGGSSVLFVPDPDFYGTASFRYTVSDGNGGSDTADVTVTVTPVNDPPVAVDDEPAITVTEDTPADIPFDALLINDTDVDTAHALLSVAGYNAAAHGTVIMDTDAKVFTFTPDADYLGPASFEYMISDGSLPSDYATVRLTVEPVNDPPVANDDTGTTPEDTQLTINVLENDADPENDTLTITDVSTPTNGTTALNTALNAVVITPEENYSGTLNFTYTVSDGNGGTDTADVSIEVTPVNDTPQAGDDNYATNEDTSLVFSASSLLDNDTDIDGDTISISRVEVTGLAHGEVAYASDVGQFAYMPTQNYHGTASFTYYITDGNGGNATATVRIAVAPVDDPPIAVNDAATVKAGNTVTVSVLLNDSNHGDSDTLAVKSALASAPLHGTAVVNPNGTISYTPTASYKGEDSLVYVLTDGTNDAQATVTFTVTARSSDNTSTPKPSTPTPEPSEDIVEIPDEPQRTARPSVTDAPTAPPAPSATPAPTDKAKLYTEEKTVESGEWNNTPVNMVVTDENGQPQSILYRLKGEEEWKTLPAGEELTFDETGEYTVEYRTGGDEEIKEKVVLVDLLPPAVPEMTHTDKDGATEISFKFLSDPGNSGNDYLILPSGETVQLTEDYTFVAPVDGNYTFTLVDKAGNTTTFTIPIKASIAAVGVSVAPAQSPLPLICGLGAGLLLLFLLLRRPVKITYEEPDESGKKRRTVQKRFARVPKKEETLTLALKLPEKAKDAKELTIRFTRPFTFVMRQRYVELTLDDRTLDTFFIEKDQKGNWEVTLPL